MIIVNVSGNIGQDAELKSLQNGDSVLSFSVASNSKIKDEKKTTWIRCSIWGKRGEALAQYLTKGTKVVAVGTLDVREYEANDGTTKTSLDVRVDQLDFMSAGGGANAGDETGEVTDEEFPHGANEPAPRAAAAKASHKPAAKPSFKGKATNGQRSAHR